MEQEYKWVMPCDFNIENSWKNDDLGVNLLDTDKILMKAVYYDTEDGLLANMHGALRVRCENGRSICCMKILSSCKITSKLLATRKLKQKVLNHTK